jgi:hypothetical protein
VAVNNRRSAERERERESGGGGFHTMRVFSVNTLPCKYPFAGILRRADTISTWKCAAITSRCLCSKRAPDGCRKTYSSNRNKMVASVNCYLVLSHVPVCCAEQWNGHYETRSSRVIAATQFMIQVAQDVRSCRLVLVTDVSENLSALVFSAK